LLTVVMHELGHELGLPDLDSPADASSLMALEIGAGLRRLPTAELVAQTTPAATSQAADQLFAKSDLDLSVAGAAAESHAVASPVPGSGRIVNGFLPYGKNETTYSFERLNPV